MQLHEPGNKCKLTPTPRKALCSKTDGSPVSGVRPTGPGNCTWRRVRPRYTSVTCGPQTYSQKWMMDLHHSHNIRSFWTVKMIRTPSNLRCAICVWKARSSRNRRAVRASLRVTPLLNLIRATPPTAKSPLLCRRTRRHPAITPVIGQHFRIIRPSNVLNKPTL